MEIDIKHACSFTGHRPERLEMRENRVISWLEEQIRKAVDDGYTDFGSGFERKKEVKPLFKTPYQTPGGRTLPKARKEAVVKSSVTPVKAKPFLATADVAVRQRTGPAGAGAGRLSYQVGDSVKHQKFGKGKVLAMEEGPKDVKVTVAFEEYGQKIMYAAFAKLEKL